MEENNLLSEKAVAERLNYYSRTFVIFAMMEHTRGRETAFLSGLNRMDNVRYLNLGSVEIFLKHLGIKTNVEKEQNKEISDPWHFLSNRKNYNIYCSLAKIDWELCPIKALSYANVQRKEQQSTLKENLTDYMTDFTGAVDFDGDQDFKIIDNKEVKVQLEISQEEAVMRAISDLKAVLGLFNEYKIEYTVAFSGTRGFHLHYLIPLEISINRKCDLATDIMVKIAKILDLKTIDRTSFNTRKVFKTFYSAVTKNDITRIVLPLSDQQINNFNLDLVEVNNVLNKIKIKNRGLLYRNENINKDKGITNFKKFLKDMEIKIPKEVNYGN